MRMHHDVFFIQGSGFRVQWGAFRHVLGSLSGELPEGVRGAALRYIPHCSITAGMPHLAALEMASHWILASLRS